MARPAPAPPDFAGQLAGWLRAQAGALQPFRHRRAGPIADTVRHERALMTLLYDAGWSRWGWSPASGGLGGPPVLRAVLYDELAAADVEIPEAFVILETLGPVLEAFAPTLAAARLPSYLAGAELWGQGFSEPDAGSDLAHLRARARLTEDGFMVSGHKIWTTLGQFARYAALLVRTGEPADAHRGLSMLWVDLRSPGVTLRPIPAASGRDEFAEMFFDNVEVPRANLVGELNGGWGPAMYLLQYERGMYAWLRQAVLLRRLRDAARGSGPPSAVSALGRAVLAVTALRARSAATVGLLSAGENPGPEISVDKVLLATAEQAVFDAIRQLSQSAMAICDDDPAQVMREEWFYSRTSSIFGGAIDIQRDIVAHRVLALPRGRPVMDQDELVMLLELAAGRMAAGGVDDLLRDLIGSGMSDAVWGDPRAWTALAVLHGRHLAASPLIDHVALCGGSAGSGLGDVPPGLVLPTPGEVGAPAAAEDGELVVDGITFTLDPAAYLAGCSDGSLIEIAASQLTMEPVAGLDPGLGLCRVTGAVPAGRVSAVLPGGWESVAARAARYLAHELIGVAEGALELAVSHVRDRQQFGRPIGAFQAVRHRLAEAFIQVSGARAVLEAGRSQAPAPTATMIEKALAGAAALTTMRAAQQVTGAMGFTAEFGLHRFVRRAYVLDSILGGNEDAEAQIGALSPGALMAALPAALAGQGTPPSTLSTAPVVKLEASDAK